MRGGDLDRLLRPAEMLRRGQVARPTVVPGQRLVRDMADEVLQEPVLPAFGRARVSLEAEDLLPRE